MVVVTISHSFIFLAHPVQSTPSPTERKCSITLQQSTGQIQVEQVRVCMCVGMISEFAFTVMSAYGGQLVNSMYKNYFNNEVIPNNGRSHFFSA